MTQSLQSQQTKTFDAQLKRILNDAKKAAKSFHSLGKSEKDRALLCIKETIIAQQNEILKANKKDLASAKKKGLPAAFIERLLLNKERIQNMVKTIDEIIALGDPVGEILEGKTLKNGIELVKKRTPLGVLLCIYESRPNVTIDISALCIKSANACILKGGKESHNTNSALAKCINEGLKKCHPSLKNAVLLVPDASKEMVAALLKRRDAIDVVVPRGGKTLVQYIMEHSSIPVIAHDQGLCHLYIDHYADKKNAITIAINAKKQRPSVCNAIETIVIHQDFPHKKEFILSLLREGITVHLDETLMKLFGEKKKNVKLASAEDWSKEYLNLTVSICQVKNIQQACDFINTYGSGHTDAIVTKDLQSARFFQENIDSACVAINVSTRFHDGGMFELGAEVGISTQKLHVRGVMTLRDLTTTKYIMTGSGQIL